MDYQASITINRPIADVWAFFQEARNDFGWQADLLGQRIIYKSPTGIGTTGRERRKSLGESAWEVTEVIPPHQVSYEVPLAKSHTMGLNTLSLLREALSSPLACTLS